MGDGNEVMPPSLRSEPRDRPTPSSPEAAASPVRPGRLSGCNTTRSAATGLLPGAGATTTSPEGAAAGRFASTERHAVVRERGTDGHAPELGRHRASGN